MDFNVNVNVKFDATPALTGVVSTLVGALKPAEVLQPVFKIPSAQALKPAEPAQEQTVSAVQAPEPKPKQEEPSGELTDEALRKIVGPITKEKGKEAVFAILDELGVKRVPDLKPDQRPAFVEKLNAL